MFLFESHQESPENGSCQQLGRLQRLLKLAALLEHGCTWTSTQLAEHFDVCQRTIIRDVQLLREANVPVSVASKSQGGYRFTNNTKSSCPQLSSDEIVALVLAIKFVGPLPESISRPCDQALAKVLSAALPEVRSQAFSVLDQYGPNEHAIPFERRQSG